MKNIKTYLWTAFIVIISFLVGIYIVEYTVKEECSEHQNFKMRLIDEHIICDTVENIKKRFLKENVEYYGF